MLPSHKSLEWFPLGTNIPYIRFIHFSLTRLKRYRHFFDPLYNATSNTEISDRESLSFPSVISHLQARAGVRALSPFYAEHFDGLERVGFKTDRLPELYHIIYERQGGHYLDVGVSQKTEDGLIKMKSDAAVSHYTKTGLAFSDGSELEADVVMFCTGFEGNMRLMVAEIVGEEVAEQLEDYWSLDKEGEIRGAWKPIGRKSCKSITSCSEQK